MFKQVFRLTFIAFIWKKYKRAIVSTLLLLAFFWLVNFAHAEYLAFAQFQPQDVNVGISFFIKWICLVLGFIIYILYHIYKPNRLPITADTLQGVDKKNDPAEPDPFTEIRQKEKLRTRTEIMLEKESSQKLGKKP